MSFTLNLGFGGLCLYVPEHDSGGQLVRMHVLLPPFEPCENHYQELVFDENALLPNQQHLGRADRRGFPNQEFDLSGVSQAPVLQLPPPQVPDLTSLVSATVPKQYLFNNDTGGMAASRVRFDAGTSRVACGGYGDSWFFPRFTSSVRMPIRVIWTLEVDTAPLIVQTVGINKTASSQQLKLYPSTRNELDLWVFNSPNDQIPKTLPPLTWRKHPNPKDPACHFAAFYKLTDSTFPLPIYDHQEAADPPECFDLKSGPGLDVTCIGAQAQPRP